MLFCSGNSFHQTARTQRDYIHFVIISQTVLYSLYSLDSKIRNLNKLVIVFSCPWPNMCLDDHSKESKKLPYRNLNSSGFIVCMCTFHPFLLRVLCSGFPSWEESGVCMCVGGGGVFCSLWSCCQVWGATGYVLLIFKKPQSSDARGARILGGMCIYTTHLKGLHLLQGK